MRPRPKACAIWYDHPARLRGRLQPILASDFHCQSPSFPHGYL
ncbi:MAG: hypothetical protein EBW38_02480 [Rhodobacteraceae bacterium]|nr:hypothetical protein [Paracoccaceae bacterium]NCW52858.1 hypothetical protein [Paracoccaceae bacterium]NDD10854.1 hypothetical protein [Paracoccaceae bacterium]NDH25150.1 hypothetical protein [Paracoccaceae bacterium]